jgi:hypothetical protein
MPTPTLRTLALCAALLGSAVVLPASPVQPPLATVLERVGRFALTQRDALSSVRADEIYRQELRAADGRLLDARLLESDIAFVQLSGRDDWLAFRNVMRVDGEATGTDTARLEKLFREGTIAGQGARIASENAAYNIGRLTRTFNIPTIVAHLLMPPQQPRLRFRRAHPGLDAAGLWIVDYEERERPTIVRTPSHDDVPVKGRLWIAPDDGHVVRATLEANRPVKSELEFTWRYDDRLATWVPSEMRERYRRIRSDVPGAREYDIVAVATYGNYRRFGVEVRIK